MSLEETVAKELYEIWRGEGNPDKLPEWEDADDWDGWEDDGKNITTQQLYIEQAHRVLRVINRWVIAPAD